MSTTAIDIVETAALLRALRPRLWTVAARTLVAAGARIFAEPHPFEVRGADGAMISMTSLSFWDPDGYFIELNQRHGGAA